MSKYRLTIVTGAPGAGKSTAVDALLTLKTDYLVCDIDWLADPASELAGKRIYIASTYWQWLDIDDFWLHEKLRGRGLGRAMLARAEQEAVTRGCTRAMLSTFSFQARGFYEKQGYRVVGALEDYPPGSAMYWMRKDFTAG